MREIKFRAWDIEMSHMIDWNEICDEEIWNVFHQDHYIAMQYTGLKDSRWVEIYEWDILKVPDNWDMYWFMAWEKRFIYYKDWCFRFKPTKDKDNQRWHCLEDDWEYKVIWNIYENTLN